ncbi:TonB-dependent receptor [Geothrix paludis]|uniref:TonB-dependent receptor n=1 Tax=Geothrix paludis TaxID=2922722 RepID=UPI001FAD1A7A|nr:TonB-dependent receptor [Geothrix paludis]
MSHAPFGPTILALLAAGPAFAAAAGSGALAGRVLDDQGRPVAQAQVRLENRVSGFRQTVVTDASGTYAAYNIPFSDYHLEVVAPGMQDLHQNISVRSNLPTQLDLRLKAAQASAMVAVEDTVSLVEAHPSAHIDIDRSTIEKIPTAVQSRAMESILLATPGFIQDENGRFHFRGSHGQVTYVVDGVPVTDQVQSTFSNSLDPSQVESMEVITGGVSAEYGGKPAAVVNLTSKSGLGSPRPFQGELSLGASRFSTRELGFGARGGTASFGYFVTGAASESDRFLDPVNFENLHNHGTTSRLFTRFDWLLGASDILRFSASGGSTDRDVVNLASQQAAGQDQRVHTTDVNLNLGWTHLLGADRSLDVAVYYRGATARLDPTRDLQPGFGGGGPDTPVWIRSDRRLDNQGAQAGYTQRNGDNTFKVGLQVVRYPLHERFDMAITDQAQASGPSDPLYPYTPAGGGNILRFADGFAPSLASAYVQDDLKAGRWTFAMGLRFDSYQGRDFTQNELQPRLGVTYALPGIGTLVRVVYDRLLITPENENLAFSTSQTAWNLVTQSATPVPRLRAETQDSYLVGLEQQLGQVARVSLDYWWKDSRNSADNSQFMNTGILFPISAWKGRFHGLDLRVDTVPIRGWSAYLSAGTVRTLYYSPTLGGLDSADPTVNGPAGTPYLIDHDQKLTAQLGVRYEQGGFFAQASGRYDSGLEAGDPATVAGNPDYAFGIPYVRTETDSLVGLNHRIKSRTILNLNAGQAWTLKNGQKLSVGLDLLNATDEKGLYNFLSAFGGTHVIPPRTLAARVKWTF